MSLAINLRTAVVGVILVVLTALAVVTTGSLVLGLVPLVAAIVFYGIPRAHPGVWSAWLLFIALIVDDPQGRNFEGRWESPLADAGALFYENLRHHVDLDFLRFSLLELCLVVLALACAVRCFGLHADATQIRRTRIFRLGLLGCMGTVGWLFVYGTLRGGEIQQSLWQARQLFWLPVAGFVFLESMPRRTDRHRLALVIISAAMIRAALGLYYYFVICRPLGYVPQYTSSHSDTVLFVGTLVICVAALLERPSRLSWALALGVVPVMLAAIAANNRRLAYVAMAACAASALPLARPAIRRLLFRAALCATPLVAVYVAVGWSSGSKIFRPVTTFRSLVFDVDTSSDTRDIENYNLTRTALARPILGQGFGHPYEEQVKAYAIDLVFAQYRFIAHNSVLWLLSVGGIVGFFGIWFILPLTSFCAWRAYPRAKTATDRVAAVAGLCSVSLYALQAYGDIGMQSWLPTLFLAANGAMAANLAADVGALEPIARPEAKRVPMPGPIHAEVVT